MVQKGNRIIVPESLRSQAINILHNKVHLGLSKMLKYVHMCMYSLGITDAIKDSVSACKSCLTYSDKINMDLTFQMLLQSHGVMCH